MYHESEEVTIVSTTACFNSNRIMVRPGREDEYSLQIKNPFEKPQVKGSDYDNAWRMDFYDNTSGVKRVDLITDGTFTIGTYHLTYFKQPVGITPFTGDGSTTARIDCELGSTIHNELVEVAVRIAAGVTTPQDYQIKVNEEQMNK